MPLFFRRGGFFREETYFCDTGITLNLKKCKWAKNQVRFCGQILESGKRLADPEKVKVIHEMKTPQTKTELRQILGFLSYFREHIFLILRKLPNR